MTEIPGDSTLGPIGDEPSGSGTPWWRWIAAIAILLLFLGAVIILWAFGGGSDPIGGVKGTTADLSPAQDQYTSQFVAPGGDLEVSLSSNPESASPGAELTYIGVLDKLATPDGGDVRVSITVPATLQVLQAFSDMGSCTLDEPPPAHVLTCTIPFTEAAEKATLTVRTMVEGAASGPFQATISVDSDDFRVESSSTSVSTAVT